LKHGSRFDKVEKEIASDGCDGFEVGICRFEAKLAGDGHGCYEDVNRGDWVTGDEKLSREAEGFIVVPPHGKEHLEPLQFDRFGELDDVEDGGQPR
jgi:hypothetical protein